MVEDQQFTETREKPSVIISSLRPLVEAIRSIRPPVRNRGYYLTIPAAILSTVETSVQTFAQWQDGSVEKAAAFGFMGVASFFLARKLLNRFHRLENSGIQ